MVLICSNKGEVKKYLKLYFININFFFFFCITEAFNRLSLDGNCQGKENGENQKNFVHFSLII